jgi:ATP-dependent DNA ligase
MNLNPPTYPARPISAGPLEVARPKRGDWYAEPKFNGWRALVHIPSGVMFNRHLRPLSIQAEFATALGILGFQKLGDASWADCEALERRHKIGRGTLILLDLIIDGTYLERRRILEKIGLDAPSDPQKFRNDALYVAPAVHWAFAPTLYKKLQAENASAGLPFYEGIVAKKADALYPVQRIGAERETTVWIKHRFIR